MKRIILLMTAFIILLAFVGCGQEVPDSSDNEDVDTSASQDNSDSGSDSSSSVDSSAPSSTESSKTDESSDDSITTDSSSTESEDKPNINIPSTDSSTANKPDSGDDSAERVFKVYLEFNGAPFVQETGDPIIASWNDGLSYVDSEVNKDGYAVAEGLDGNYIVTLKNIPDGYAYNPNPYNEETKTYGYEATNDYPEITIEIYKIGTTKGAGSTEHNRTVMTRTGVYRATLTSSGHKIFFEFAPKSSGTYTIESWVPVTDDKINPKVDVYTSSFAAPIYQYTIDAGATEGKYYTKNFKYEVEIAEEMISSGGQVVFVFSVYATARNDRYFPLNVDFAVTYDGGFELDRTRSEFMVPDELYGIMAKKLEEMKAFSKEELYEEYGLGEPSYTSLAKLSSAKLWDGASLNLFLNQNVEIRAVAVEYLFSYFNKFYSDIKGKSWVNPASAIGSKLVLIGTGYEYNEKTGFYHKYDEKLYENDPYGYGKGFGPVLYADISSPVRTGILEDPFTSIEYHGNKALTVSNGTENYKLFIESYEKANAMTVQVLGGEIECPEEFKNLIGYASIVNSDGAVPVTKELAEFLQKYSINQAMFMDGDGWAEKAETPYQSTEEYQWLFACGYYE